MKLLSALRSAVSRLAFLLAFGLCPAFALAALNETYEGLLVPDSFETPIPITVEVRELSGLLVGRVTSRAPLSGSAPISGGENEYGKCTVLATLPSGIGLRLAGTCLPHVFEGRYSLLNKGRDGRPQGSFRLLRKEARDDPEKPRPRSAPLLASTPLTECIKANTRCLIGCPRGDYNVEFLCSNRCRQKFQSCKGKSSLPPAPAPAAREPAADEQR